MKMQTAVVVLLILPFANAEAHLRAQSLAPDVKKMFFQMEAQPASCQCSFEDQCSCEGALKFMECIKKSCDSGECNCIEKSKNTNHWKKACSAMENECSDIGLTCGQTDATCDKEKVDWEAGSELQALKIEKTKAPKKKNGKHAEKKAEDKKEPAKEAKKDEDGEVISKVNHEKKVQAVTSHGHRNFAGVIAMFLVVGCTTVIMASSSNKLVSSHTWSTIDFVVIHFLALSWFVVVTHFLDFFNFVGYQRILFHAAIAIVFILISLFVSWRFRQDTNRVAVFNAIFGAMLLWINAGFVQTVQQNATTATGVAIRSLGVMGFYSLLSFACFFLMQKTCERGWGDSTIDSLAGGAIASGFVALVHMIISGTYQQIGGHHAKPPSFWQTMIMLSTGLLYLVFGIITQPVIARKIDPAKYWPSRALSTVSAFLGVLPYFSFVLSLGHLIIDNLGYTHGDVQAQTHLALASTAVGILLINICAFVPAVKRSTNTSSVLVGLGGFMAGVAWSGLLDNSLNMMMEGEGYDHPFIVKLCLTGFLTAFIFPTYCLYLKPVVMAKTA